MAQDHFKTPPDPKKGHGMTKNPQKSKKSSRVGQEDMAWHEATLCLHQQVLAQQMVKDTTDD